MEDFLIIHEGPDMNPKEDLNLEEGSAKITLQDVYVLFYTLVKQNQQQRPGSKMAFKLAALKNLPKKIAIHFERKDGKLLAWIPEKRKKRSPLILPKHRIITPN